MPAVTARRQTSAGSMAELQDVPWISPNLMDETLVKIPMRDYQATAFRSFFDDLGDRSTVKVVELPTGTGKTRVGVAAALCLAKAGFTVLWVCKRWELLKMAAEDFGKLPPGQTASLRRLGGDRRKLPLEPVTEASPGQIVFTSLQTWFSKKNRLPAAVAASRRVAVVWDEVHWGYLSRIGRAFSSIYLGQSPMLGLSATPPDSDKAKIIYRRSPEEFLDRISEISGEYIEGVLATPKFIKVNTGIDWAPEMFNDDYTSESLKVLAENKLRNLKIVETVASLYANGEAKHMVVFAANIPHAVELAGLLSVRGVAAKVIHSQMPHREQQEAEKQFRDKTINVLVNVDQLTEGFDHPPVDAVVLTRPTKSRRRLIQMVGRGFRKAPGKSTFKVVDFADNLTLLQRSDLRAETAFRSLVRKENTLGRSLPVRYAMPDDIPWFENYAIDGHRCVPFVRNQTFGLEMEFALPSGVSKTGAEAREWARKLISGLKDHVVADVEPDVMPCKGGPLTSWRAMLDLSAGPEIISPILANADGLDELRRGCEAISGVVRESGGRLRVNHRTGLHLTMATRLDTDEKIRGVVRFVQRLEPGLFTMVPPSRLYPFDPDSRTYSRRAGNRYCRPLRELGDPDHLDLDSFIEDHENRYRTVNLTKLRDEVQLLEVRMHSGTHEFEKIAVWISLWMQLFNKARHDGSGPARPGLVLPGRNSRISLAIAEGEDIVKLLKDEGIVLSPEFKLLLKQRRKELRKSWEKVLPHRVDRWEKLGWYD